MRISFEENQAYERYLQSIKYKKIGKSDNRVEYEGTFECSISRQVLSLNSREFAKFVKTVEVSEGRKKKEGDILAVRPSRSKLLPIKVSEDEYKLLNKRAEELDINLSEYVRGTLLKDIAKRLGIT